VSLAVRALVTALGMAACLAACGPDTVSAPTVSASATATATPTAAITGSPTPPPATARPTPTSAPAVSATGPAGQSMTLNPGTLPSGGTVHITGYALSGCTSGLTLLSNAFPGPQEFAGVHAVTATSTPDGHFSATVTIPASTAPGGYSVTARCGGGNLGLNLTLTVTSPA
jgi:hypothetical protein